jgi:predicted permease
MGNPKNWFTRRNERRQLSEEIQQHLAERIDALTADGMSREEAAYAARREFGNVTAIEEKSHDVWKRPVLDALYDDAKFAFRQFRRNPGFALTVMLTLAVGIGATTAIFSLVHAVLLKPLPFPQQDKLMWLKEQDHALPGIVPNSLSYPNYFDWRAQNHTFAGMASYRSGTVTLQSGSEPQRVDAVVVSANLFSVLGVIPSMGRDFRMDEEKPGHRAVMLSYAFWQSAFGSGEDITSKTIRLDDHQYAVAGVMPRGFRFPLEGLAPALWVSLADDADGKDAATGQRGFDCLDVIARLRPGATVEQAKADLSLIAAKLAQQYPANNKRYSSAIVEPELQHITGDARPALRLLFGAVMLLLLIVCCNVAGLLLARGSRRSAEFALRASIGASRPVLIRQLLVESIVLSLCGGAAGVALSYALLRGLVSLMPLDIPRIEGASIDTSVLAFVMFVSVLTGLLFGALPAWRMSAMRPAQAMRDGGRSVTGTRHRRRWHSAMVIAQTAVGLVLLVSSGLLIRSFIRILSVDPGFDASHVLTARAGVSFERLNHDQHAEFYNQLVARLSRIPGVQSASAGWPLPMTDNHASVSFSIEGRPIAKGSEPEESVGVVMPGYFSTMRIPLLSGRAFGEQDGTRGVPVVIINEAFARKYFPGETPLGRRMQAGIGDGVIEHPVREIVGVVGNIKSAGLTTGTEPQYYLPYSQALVTNPYLTLRGSGDPVVLEGALRGVVHDMDSTVPVYQVFKLEDYISKSAARPRFHTLLLTSFAGIALLLAAVGLYGLLSYMVVERTVEIGVRVALGAKRWDVLRMVVQHGLALTLAGLTAGLASSAMITRLLSGLLYETHPSDALTFVVTTGVLLMVSLAASAIPAYRAARLDPIEALRES